MASTEDRKRAFARSCAVLVFGLAVSLRISAAESEPKADLPVSERLSRLATEAYAYPPGGERREALAALASLRELAGDVEGAASAWADAAFAAGEARDDAALLEAARCLLALGEIDRASADLRTVLITGRDKESVSRARYLGAQISAFRGDDDAEATLSSFVDDSDYADRRPATLYLLWRLTSKDSYRDRLLGDHEKSPEAALASSSENAPVSVAATPLWLFFPGGPAAASRPLPSGAQSPIGPAASAPPPASVPETQVPSSVASGAAGKETVTLQIGLFKQEENAKALMKRLSDAAFKPEMTKRTVRSDEYFAVTVSGGADTDETILRLKDAGFESFPLY